MFKPAHGSGDEAVAARSAVAALCRVGVKRAAVIPASETNEGLADSVSRRGDACRSNFASAGSLRDRRRHRDDPSRDIEHTRRRRPLPALPRSRQTAVRRFADTHTSSLQLVFSESHTME